MGRTMHPSWWRAVVNGMVSYRISVHNVMVLWAVGVAAVAAAAAGIGRIGYLTAIPTTTNCDDPVVTTLTHSVEPIKVKVPDMRPWHWAVVDAVANKWVHWPTRLEKLHHDLMRDGHYEALPDPASVMISSHAITGALLKEHYIEAYRVYQRPSSDTTLSVFDRTELATVDPQPQVIGLVRVGTQVDGHKGIIHGGILSMLVDDVLGYGFYSMGWPAAFTANLTINFRKPVRAQSMLRIECHFRGRERRKLIWEIRAVDAQRPHILYVEATSLYVIPRHVFRHAQRQRK